MKNAQTNNTIAKREVFLIHFSAKPMSSEQKIPSLYNTVGIPTLEAAQNAQKQFSTTSTSSSSSSTSTSTASSSNGFQRNGKKPAAVAADVAHTSLARSSSYSAATKVPPELIIETCMLSRRLPALLVAIRTNKLVMGALKKAYRNIPMAEFRDAMTTTVSHPQCGNRPTTVLHTMFRYCHWKFLQLIVNECMVNKMPREWFLFEEPETGSTILHVLAQRTHSSVRIEEIDESDLRLTVDADELKERQHLLNEAADKRKHVVFVNQFVAAVDREHLAKLDAFGHNVVHYLVVSGYREAYKIVEKLFPDLCEASASSSNGAASPLLIMSRRTEQMLEHAREENRQLKINLRTAEDTAQQLQSMHEALNVRIQRGQIGAELNLRNLDTLAQQQHEQNLQKARLDNAMALKEAEMSALRLERDIAKAAAEQARQSFADANRRLSEYESETAQLRAKLQSEKQKIERAESEVQAIEAENAKLCQDIKERSQKYDEMLREATTDSVAAARAEEQQRLRDAELALQASITERLAKADIDRQTALRARDTMQRELSAREEAHKAEQRLYDDAKQRSAQLEQKLEESNRRQRTMQSELLSLNETIEQLRRNQIASTEHYTQEVRELAAERERIAVQLSESQRLLREAQEALEREKTAAKTKLDNLPPDTDAAQRNLFETAATERMQKMLAELEEMRRATAETEARAALIAAHDRDNAVLVELLKARHEEEVRAMTARLEEARTSLLLAQSRANQGEAQTNEARQIAEEREAIIADLRKQLETKKISSTKTDDDNEPPSPRRQANQRDVFRQRTLSRSASRQQIIGQPVAPPLSANGEVSSTTESTTLSTATVITPRRRQITIVPDAVAGSSVSSSTAATSSTTQSNASAPQACPAATANSEMTIDTFNMRLNADFWEKVCEKVARGAVRDITVLLDFGMSANTRDAENRPLLEIAIRSVASLYNRNELDATGKTMLKDAIQMIPLLLQRGAEWTEVDDYLRNELGMNDKLPKAVYHMLQNRDDMSPFSTAIARKDFTRAIDFIDNVADLDRVPTIPKAHFKELFTYLHIAVYEESAMLVQMLVQRGANVNVRDAKNRTPLHLLIVKCRDRKLRLLIAQFLLAGGANPDATCSYQKLIDECRNRQQSLAATIINSTTSSSSTMKIDAMSRLSADVMQYSTPLKLAASFGDDELVACMKNPRYLAVSCATLAKHIVSYAQTQSTMEIAIADGLCTQQHPIYTIYSRYKNVFLAFNPRHQHVAMMCDIHAAAGVNTATERADEIEKKLRAMYVRDTEYLTNFMKSGVVRTNNAQAAQKMLAEHSKTTLIASSSIAALSKPENSANYLNSTFQWKLGLLLSEAIAALQDRWFDVSPIIQQSAQAEYPAAVLEAIKILVQKDDAIGVNAILCRPIDRLFGDDINVNTIIDARQRYTCIELAASYGSINVLETLMAQQRNDIYKKGASGRNVPQIAIKSSQPLALVAIDYFMHRNQMTDEACANANDYGLFTEDTENGVLHLAARASRDDLMRHCIDQVRFQLQKKNKAKETPLDVADTAIALGMPTKSIEIAKLACRQILLDAISGKSLSKNADSSSNSSTSKIVLPFDLEASLKSAARPRTQAPTPIPKTTSTAINEELEADLRSLDAPPPLQMPPDVTQAPPNTLAAEEMTQVIKTALASIGSENSSSNSTSSITQKLPTSAVSPRSTAELLEKKTVSPRKAATASSSSSTKQKRSHRHRKHSSVRDKTKSHTAAADATTIATTIDEMNSISSDDEFDGMEAAEVFEIK